MHFPKNSQGLTVNLYLTFAQNYKLKQFCEFIICMFKFLSEMRNSVLDFICFY